MFRSFMYMIVYIYVRSILKRIRKFSISIIINIRIFNNKNNANIYNIKIELLDNYLEQKHFMY